MWLWPFAHECILSVHEERLQAEHGPPTAQKSPLSTQNSSQHTDGKLCR